MPVEPRPSPWALPDLEDLPPGQELVAVGADLAPGTLLSGYRAGIFAMPEGPLLGWWSPDPRGVLRPGDVHVSRSLRRAMAKFEVTVDRAFEAVVAACAAPGRPHGWITPEYVASYRSLHALGWAHSIEVWDRHGKLAGGLFGVQVGGLFAAESMFHAATDASKVAVVALAGLLAVDADSRRIVDVQWCTEHLASLGAVEIGRHAYLRALAETLMSPPVLGAQPGADTVLGGPASRIRWRRA